MRMILAFVPGTRAWRERRDMMLCHRTAERIQEIVDGELSADRASTELIRHLEACRRCQAEAEAFEELKAAIARAGRNDDPELVRELEELSRRLAGEDPDDGPGS